MLMADGFGHHLPKEYIYFAMAFSLFVELLNLKARSRSSPVRLHEAYSDRPASRPAPEGSPNIAIPSP